MYIIISRHTGDPTSLQLGFAQLCRNNLLHLSNWQLSCLSPCPVSILLQPLVDQRLCPQDNLPPRPSTEFRYLRVRCRMITHFQDRSFMLLLGQEDF